MDQPTNNPPPEEPAPLGLQAKAEHIRKTAQRVALRLIKARGPGPQPTTDEEFMTWIETLMSVSKKYGVTLLPYEKRCVLQWHSFRRALAAIPE